MSTAKNCFPSTRKDKSSFAMTCNRLSLFLKEKGSLKDIGINAPFDVIGKPESSSLATEKNQTTVDLLSKIESPVIMSVKTEKSINQLTQYVLNDCKPDYSTNRGQELVFDSISADKARDMMLTTSAAAASSSFDNQIPLASTSNCPSEGFGSRYRILPGLQLNGLDLPIARRSSLYKFLSMRKDRATERAPYQLPNRLMAAPSSNHKFDLNLEISL